MSFASQIVLYIIARGAEQGAYNLHAPGVHRVGCYGAHTAQPSDARAAQQVEQQRLGLVVPVVCHRYGLAMLRLCRLLKPIIAQVAGSHFYPHFLFPRVRQRIKIAYQKTHVHLLAQAAYKPLVAHTLFPPQVEIAMRRHAVVPGTEQYIKQSHAVRSSAYAHQHTVALLQQPLVLYIFAYAPKHQNSPVFSCSRSTRWFTIA